MSCGFPQVSIVAPAALGRVLSVSASPFRVDSARAVRRPHLLDAQPKIGYFAFELIETAYRVGTIRSVGERLRLHKAPATPPWMCKTWAQQRNFNP